MPGEITSRDNERVKYARRLATQGAFRAGEGLFFAEGRRLCADLAAVLPAKTAFYTPKLLDAFPEAATLAEESFLVSEHVADKLADTRASQGLYCIFQLPRAGFDDLDPAAGVLVCEALQDPSNTGAVLRSAAAFGFGGVVFTAGSADPFAPKALRASMGAAGHVPVVTDVTFEEARQELKRRGVLLCAAALCEGALPLGQARPEGPAALLVGNEGTGLSPEALAAADRVFTIPMHNGVESLNAAVAASVLMYAFKETDEADLTKEK